MIELLDCTLRDGGHTNNWDFSEAQIASVLNNLTNAGMDYIEVGYLTSILQDVQGSTFLNMKSASRFLPTDRKNCKYVLMSDVFQFDANSLSERDENTADGIRVVFYKRQIDQTLPFCEKVVQKGYDLLLQPMVTVDYSQQEFEALVEKFCGSLPTYAVSIVDSFGCMTTKELRSFVSILDENLDKNIKIGFHGHNNMLLAQVNASLFFEMQNDRDYIIDSSVNGMGRGAGNLQTELIAHYYNAQYGEKYDLDSIFRVISEVTEPEFEKNQWGYSPYYMITAMRCAHPNFASYLLAEHDVSVSDFAEYIKLIAPEMLSKCTRTYVDELYLQFTEMKAKRTQ
ncbi:MAG TPA: hypothetical protein DEB31_09795 [Clostridiales bacterium]|nr:hypothetical protein [Clostridiales bacterium]